LKKWVSTIGAGVAFAILRNLGEHRRAIGYYEQALKMAREIGDLQS